MKLDDLIDTGLKNAEAKRDDKAAITRAVLHAIKGLDGDWILDLIAECGEPVLEPAGVAEAWNAPGGTVLYRSLSWKYESKYGSFWIVAHPRGVCAKRSLDPNEPSVALSTDPNDVGKLAEMLGVLKTEKSAEQGVHVALGTTVLYTLDEDDDVRNRGQTRLAQVINSKADGSGTVDLRVCLLGGDYSVNGLDPILDVVKFDPSGAPGMWRFMPPGFEADLTRPLEK